MDSNRVKQTLEEYWKENIEGLIERYFGEYFENYWNDFLAYINNILLHKPWRKARAEQKGFLLELAAIQLSRRPENLRALAIDAVVYWAKGILDRTIPGLGDTLDDEFNKDVVLAQLYK